MFSPLCFSYEIHLQMIAALEKVRYNYITNRVPFEEDLP